MSQIDVLLQYASHAAALADPALAAFVINGTFDESRVFDNGGAGLQVWNSSADTTSTVTGPGGGTVTVTQHQFQPGYSLIASYADASIAVGTANPNVAPWKANAAVLLIADRDAAKARDPGFIYYASSTISATLAQWRLQPVPLGSTYPFGSP